MFKFKINFLVVGAILFANLANAAPITPAQIGAAQSAGTLQKAWITGSSSMV